MLLGALLGGVGLAWGAPSSRDPGRGPALLLVHAPGWAEGASCLVPWGRWKVLRHDPEGGTWILPFAFPAELPEGTYPLRLHLAGPGERVKIRTTLKVSPDGGPADAAEPGFPPPMLETRREGTSLEVRVIFPDRVLARWKEPELEVRLRPWISGARVRVTEGPAQVLVPAEASIGRAFEGTVPVAGRNHEALRATVEWEEGLGRPRKRVWVLDDQRGGRGKEQARKGR